MAVEFRGRIYGGVDEIARALYDAGEPADFVERDWWGWKVVLTGSKIQLWRFRGLVPHPDHLLMGKIVTQLVDEREVA